MSNTIDDLIGAVESEGGYLTDAWLDRLRACFFSLHDGARFLAWLPNIKPHLACCVIKVEHGETDLGSPVEFIEFHTGGWSGAEELISVMLEHFWIRYFHTKWGRGGHFSFEVPSRLVHAPASGADAPPAAFSLNNGGATAGSPTSEPPPDPRRPEPREIEPLNDIVGFLLFAASRSGSWEALRLFGPDERQRFVEWAEQEIAHLQTLGWALSVERRDQAPRLQQRRSF
jgi:hypothetical protein